MTKMVRLNDDTYEEVLSLGQFRETMDDIINRCVKFYKEKQKK